jgi:hypothetical protein
LFYHDASGTSPDFGAGKTKVFSGKFSPVYDFLKRHDRREVNFPEKL